MAKRAGPAVAATGVWVNERPHDPDRRTARYAFQVAPGDWYFVIYTDDVSFVPHGQDGHWWLPERFEVLVSERVLPHEVLLAFLVEQGRPQCTALELRRYHRHLHPVTLVESDEWKVRPTYNEITSERLRVVPVRRLTRLAVLSALHSAPNADAHRPNAAALSQWNDLYASKLERPTRTGGAYPLDAEHYRAVASIYRRAVAAGGAPTNAVRRSMQVSPQTAARYVSQARRRGFLGPTTQGRAGELPTTSGDQL